MKIYTNKVQVGNVEAGNFFFYDEDTKSYIMSKGNTDVSENSYSNAEYYISLPVSFVENNESFEEVGVAPKQKEDTIIAKVEKRMQGIEDTINMLEQSKLSLSKEVAAILDDTILSLQKEFWTLESVIKLA